MLFPSVSSVNKQMDTREQNANKVMNRNSDHKNALNENEIDCHKIQ